MPGTSLPSAAQSRGTWALSAALAMAVLAWDPRAPAALPKQTLALAVVAIGLALVTARWVGGNQLPVLHFAIGSLGTLLLVAFALWVGIGLGWGTAAGIRELVSCGLMALVALVAATLPGDSARQVIQQTCLILGGITTLWILVELGLGQMLHAGHGNSNRAGLVLGVALLPALGWWRGASSAHRWPQWALLLLFAAWLLALFVAESRTAWIAVAAGALCAWRVSRAQEPALAAPRRGLGLALLPLGVGWAAVPLASIVSPLLPGEAGRALSGRAWIWDCSWRAGLDQFPLGAGTGRFASAFLEAQASALESLGVESAARHYHFVLDAHHDWLGAWVSGGLPGPSLLAAGFVCAMVAYIRARDPWSSGALACLAIAASGDGALFRPAVTIVAGLLIGAAASSAAPSTNAALPQRGSAAAPWARWLSVAPLAATAWLLWATTHSWIAERWVSLSREASPEERTAMLERAVRFAPHAPNAAFELGLAYLEQGEAARAALELRRSIALEPGPTKLVALGNAWVNDSALRNAVSAYRHALRLNPGSFRAHANLASTLTTLGELDAAARQLSRARELFPGHPRLREMEERLRRRAAARSR